MCRSRQLPRFEAAGACEKISTADVHDTSWRMLLAGDRLENSSDPISAIALSLGYESESAFSTAFKRVMDSSPRKYGRGRNPASPSYGQREGARANRLEPIAG
jgi:hypothetical protein